MQSRTCALTPRQIWKVWTKRANLWVHCDTISIAGSTERSSFTVWIGRVRVRQQQNRTLCITGSREKWNKSMKWRKFQRVMLWLTPRKQSSTGHQCGNCDASHVTVWYVPWSDWVEWCMGLDLVLTFASLWFWFSCNSLFALQFRSFVIEFHGVPYFLCYSWFSRLGVWMRKHWVEGDAWDLTLFLSLLLRIRPASLLLIFCVK
jgi:hypothetical protein